MQGTVANIPRRKVAFKQADISRAVKGATQAGLTIGSVEVSLDGKIVIKFLGAGGAGPKDDTASAFDSWVTQNAHTA